MGTTRSVPHCNLTTEPGPFGVEQAPLFCLPPQHWCDGDNLSPQGSGDVVPGAVIPPLVAEDTLCTAEGMLQPGCFLKHDMLAPPLHEKQTHLLLPSADRQPPGPLMAARAARPEQGPSGGLSVPSPTISVARPNAGCLCALLLISVSVPGWQSWRGLGHSLSILGVLLPPRLDFQPGKAFSISYQLGHFLNKPQSFYPGASSLIFSSTLPSPFPLS